MASGSGPLQSSNQWGNTGGVDGGVSTSVNGNVRPGGGIGPTGGTTNPPFIPPPGGGGGGPVTLYSPIRVSGLFRFASSDDFRVLVGAYNYADRGDQLFIVQTNTNYAALLPLDWNPDSHKIITSVGAHFQFVSQRARVVKGDPAWNSTDPATNYWAIGTNGLDMPFALKRGAGGVNTWGVIPVSLIVCQSDQYVDPLPVSTKRMVGVQAIAAYAGSMVWGGFRMRDADPTTTADEDNYDEYIAFSDVGTPHKLATTANLISTIKVGDSPAEPITAIAPTVVSTDSVGMRGQLLVFTGARVTVFDGLPPQSQNPTGLNFASTVIKGVGCNAPGTVVNCPDGVVFLGSDNFIYLIHGVDGPRRIGSAVEPLLRGMTPRQQRQCAACFDPKGFYKISFPNLGTFGLGKGAWVGASDPAVVANANADVPTLQLWADLRQLDPQRPDLGAKWFGPMTGLAHSCFAVCNGPNDRGEIYAGSAVDGSIFELNREDLTTDPTPTNPLVALPIDPVGITGLYDMGDAHQIKLVTGMEVGVGTNTPVILESSIIMAADTISLSKSTDFENIITPQNDIIGDSFTIGTSLLASGDVFEPIALHPPARIRGMMFRFVFRFSRIYWINAVNAIFNKIDFKNNNVTYAATLNDGYYSATTLAAEIQRAMRATDTLNGLVTCTFDSYTGLFTIGGGTGVFQLLFSTGANAAASPRTLTGFGVVDRTGAVTYTAAGVGAPNGLLGRNFVSDLEFQTVPITRRK